MTKEDAIKTFRDKSPVMMIYRISAGDRKDVEYDGISAVILRRGRNGQEIIQLELIDKKSNSVSITTPEYVYPKGAEVPPFPTERQEEKIRFKCGIHKNVLLEQWQLDKLERLCPDTYKQCINELSEEIAVKCTPYKNHYAEIVKRLTV